MENSSPIYSLGDMIFHLSYGIGKINSIETRPLNGVKVECFMVKTDNGDYWFPTGILDNPRIHPVASQNLIQKAIEILRSAPKGLENDRLQWKERIDDVQANGDFLATSSLIRDLSSLKTKRKLNRTQDQALKKLQNRLFSEWAASAKVDKKSIQSMVQAYLQESNV